MSYAIVSLSNKIHDDIDVVYTPVAVTIVSTLGWPLHSDCCFFAPSRNILTYLLTLGWVLLPSGDESEERP